MPGNVIFSTNVNAKANQINADGSTMKSDVRYFFDEIIPIIVDLPAPFGPNNAKKSPRSTLKSIPLRAITLLEYVFLRDFNVIAFI